jgi:hypothetical protein
MVQGEDSAIEAVGQVTVGVTGLEGRVGCGSKPLTWPPRSRVGMERRSAAASVSEPMHGFSGQQFRDTSCRFS